MANEPASKSAVITGASSGLGAVFARKLAERGYDLVLVARREERLQQLADELASLHRVTAEIRVTDLADFEAVECLAATVSARADLELLVNNAGFGSMGRFVEVDPRQQLDMIRVHVLASACLAQAALPGMIERGRGHIINVSSIGAWLPCEGNVQYAATKSYLNSFSEGLQHELRGSGVRVQALCPGFTYTEFHDIEQMAGFDRTDVTRTLWMSAEDVVDCSLRALNRRRVIVIPGWLNRRLAEILRSTWLRPIVRAVARYKTKDMHPPSPHDS